MHLDFRYNVRSCVLYLILHHFISAVGGIFFIEAERLGLLKLRAKFLLPAELKIQSARCRHWDQTLQLGAASSETQGHSRGQWWLKTRYDKNQWIT